MFIVKVYRYFVNKIDAKKTKKIILNEDKSEEFRCAKKVDGFSLKESLIYQLDINDSKNYISTYESYGPRLKFDKKYFPISDDKLLFSSVFSNYVNVPKNIAFVTTNDIVLLEKISSNKELYETVIKDGGCFVKPRFGFNGQKTFKFYVCKGKLYCNSIDYDCDAFINFLLKQKNVLVQKLVKQGAYAKSLYPNSINTIRIITIATTSNSGHEIVGALQRIGTAKSGNVDNFSQGGLSSLIDLDNGTLGRATGAFRIKDGRRQFYDRHPDTGAQILGVVVPHWDLIKKGIIQLTKMAPYFKYVAWDVAVTDDGFSLIEINMKSSLDVFQCHHGMRNTYLGQKYKERGIIK